MNGWLDTGNLLGFVAAGLVLATFSMRTMLPLRLVAIAGNLAFIAYGLYEELAPVVTLHALLLPLNIWRAVEIANVSRRIRHARHYGFDVSSLLPLMKQEQLPGGHVLFNKDDVADRLYVVIEGKVRIPENAVLIDNGSLFGEMGLFVKGGRRTAGAICETPCRLASLTYDEAARLFFQNPEFGFALNSLLATRFNENIERLREQKPG